MVMISTLNNTLVNISNAERRGRRQVIVRPSSKVVVKYLQCMQKHGTSSLLVLHSNLKRPPSSSSLAFAFGS